MGGFTGVGHLCVLFVEVGLLEFLAGRAGSFCLVALSNFGP